jgi:Fe-S-cluster-containing hydrogenase component 2
MVKMLLVDMDKCTGCKQCSLACSLIKEDLFDPNRGRIKILKKEDIALSIPLLCEQCDTFPCISACPEGALTRNETTGIITVNEEICTECGSCVEACTYHGWRSILCTALRTWCARVGGQDRRCGQEEEITICENGHVS